MTDRLETAPTTQAPDEGRRTTITEAALRGLVSQVPWLRLDWPEGQNEPTIYRDEAEARSQPTPDALRAAVDEVWNEGGARPDRDHAAIVLMTKNRLLREALEATREWLVAALDWSDGDRLTVIRGQIRRIDAAIQPDPAPSGEQR